MKPKKTEQKNPSELRKRAEEKLKSKITSPKILSDKETQQLIHKLQVHQIELEMQNDELRKAQVEIEESRSKYSDLYDFAPVGYFTFDKQGLILETNLTAAKKLGIERSGLIKKPFRTYIVTEDKNIFDQHFQKVFKNENCQTCEIRLKRKNGGEFYALLESISANDLKGNSLCRTSVIDITKRKQAEEEREQLRHQYNLILQSAGEGILGLDLKGNHTFVNPSAAKKLGYEVVELIGQPSHTICHHSKPDGTPYPKERCPIDAAYKDGTIHAGDDEVFWRKDGTSFPVRYTSTPIREGNKLTGAVVVFRDITERKKAAEALQRIEWMLAPKKQLSEDLKKASAQSYGDLTKLNTVRLILDSVGEEVLNDIAKDYTYLLETSSAIYEKNGDYALGIFSSGWCQFLDCASRRLCQTEDNQEALNSGKWLCHESCWTNVSKVAIETGQPVDIICSGEIHLYAVPVLANGQVVGSINIGYGNPPQEPEVLQRLAEKYAVNVNELLERAKSYESRPPFIIEIAKERLQSSAKLIGTMIERRQAETLLLETRDYMENLINHANAPIIIRDPESKITRVNFAFELLTGYTSAEVIGQKLYMLFPKETRDESIIRIERALDSEYWESVEIPILCKDGNIKIALWNSANIYAEDGKTLLATMTQGQDITERKMMEEELKKYREHLERQVEDRTRELKESQAMLIQVEKMAGIGTLAGGIAHEVNNPLTSILTYSQLMQSKIKNGTLTMDKVMDYAGKMEDVTLHCKATIQNLLDFSRETKDSKQLFPLPEVINASVSLLFHQLALHNIKISKEIEDVPILANKNQLMQVFANMLTNAKDAMPEGGELTIAAQKADRHVKIVFSDTGTGISKDDLKRIFEPFFTTKEVGKGTGIGLYMCYKIIENMGGAIEVKSEIGKGTIFTIKLPV